MPGPPGKPLSRDHSPPVTPPALGRSATGHLADDISKGVGIEKVSLRLFPRAPMLIRCPHKNKRTSNKTSSRATENGVIADKKAITTRESAAPTPQVTANGDNDTVTETGSSPPPDDQSQPEPMKGYEKFKRQYEAYTRKFGEKYEEAYQFKKFMTRNVRFHLLYEEEVNKNKRLKRKAEVSGQPANRGDKKPKVDSEAK